MTVLDMLRNSNFVASCSSCLNWDLAQVVGILHFFVEYGFSYGIVSFLMRKGQCGSPRNIAEKQEIRFLGRTLDM